MRFHVGLNDMFFSSVSGQFSKNVNIKFHEMKLIAGVLHCSHFDRNEISFPVINVI